MPNTNAPFKIAITFSDFFFVTGFSTLKSTAFEISAITYTVTTVSGIIYAAL